LVPGDPLDKNRTGPTPPRPSQDPDPGPDPALDGRGPDADGATGDGGGRPGGWWRRHRARRTRHRDAVRSRRTVVGRHPRTTVLVLVVLLLSPLLVSMVSAATDVSLGSTPGARLTEWVRDHGGRGLVVWAEDAWYSHHAPPKGGRPPAGAIPAPVPVALSPSTSPSPSPSPAPSVSPSVSPAPAPAPVGPPHLPAPAPLTPFASPPIPGEGQWHPVGRDVDGVPAVYEAFLRPNATNTSLVTGVAWMDTTLLSATLYAGSSIPGTGGPWTDTAPLRAPATDSLVAAFNSGFRMQDADGGYYADGRVAARLRTGAASLVIYRDGVATVADWGRDASMGPDIAAVRQNLDLIVDGGRPVPGLVDDDFARWGFTVGNKIQVWRSGLGVTADGALVYVGGSGLSIVDLADILQRAGAVRAMELDINTAWVNFFSFAPPAGEPAAPSNGSKLTADETQWVGRYFAPCSRDFITMSARLS